mmetsp:Transcript_19692/g.36246  ORF Transcript_19692/g.36246 Transcript_19692/m.36246 type:complete len:203 (+) Transcript_19692:1572-2180(+)
MLTKVIFDLGWLLFFVLSFFLPVAIYMKDFSISVTAISFNFQYMGMGAHVSVPFNDFQENYCGSESASGALCKNLVLFKAAGLLYAILGALSLICFIYTLLQAVLPRYKWLTARGVVYLIPLFYALAVLVFFVINIVFTERPQASFSSEYALTFGMGSVCMLLAELCAIAGAVAYIWENDSKSGLHERLIDQQAVQRTTGNV